MKKQRTEPEARDFLLRSAYAYVECLNEFGEQEFEAGKCLCSACDEHLGLLEDAVRDHKRAKEAEWLASLSEEERALVFPPSLVTHRPAVVISTSVRPDLVIAEAE